MSPDRIDKPDEEWRTELTPEQYAILRKGHTEDRFAGEYVHTKDPGIYRCVACGTELFSSETKFDSRTGWPSFTDPATPENVELRKQWVLFLRQTEVLCAGCGGHLGHVFNDGPGRGVKRYCINSAALELDPRTP